MTQTVQNMSIASGGKTAEQQAAHDAAMAAKGEGVLLSVTELNADGTRNAIAAEPTTTPQQPSAPAKVQKPEGVPDKFWNAEKAEVNYAAWAKSTAELEAKFTQQQQGKKPDEQTPNGEVPKGETPAQQNAINTAASEYAEKGELSVETIASLVKSGIDEATINTYMAGLKAQETLTMQQAHQITGGEQNYAAMVQWAGENLSDAEIDAFDAAVADPAQRTSAIEGLYARFQLKGNFEGTPVQGQRPTTSGEMFRSRHEMQAAMSDPRYTKGDKAFHADVQMKMANALAAGIDLFS